MRESVDTRGESRVRVKPLLDEVTELSYRVQNEPSVVIHSDALEFLYEISRNTAGSKLNYNMTRQNYN